MTETANSPTQERGTETPSNGAEGSQSQAQNILGSGMLADEIALLRAEFYRKMQEMESITKALQEENKNLRNERCSDLRRFKENAPNQPIHEGVPADLINLQDTHLKAGNSRKRNENEKGKMMGSEEYSEDDSDHDTNPELAILSRKGKRKVQSPSRESAGRKDSNAQKIRRTAEPVRISPFTQDVRTQEPPKKFNMPNFKLYTGKTDPSSHVRYFQQIMTLYEHLDGFMCRIFPNSLDEMPLKWFNRLEPRSIHTFDQLAQKFIRRFVTSTKQSKEVNALVTLRKRREETLREYTTRYWNVMNEIEECTESIALGTFKLGIPEDSGLHQSLTKKQPKNLNALLSRIEQYARLEDETVGRSSRTTTAASFRRHRDQEPLDIIPRRNYEGRTSHRDQAIPTRFGSLDANDDRKVPDKYPRHGPLANQGIHTVFKEPIYKILQNIKNHDYFRWPPAMVGDPSRRNQRVKCSYHRDIEHATEDCRALKDFLEELVRQGHLRSWVASSRAAGNPNKNLKDESNLTPDEPPRGIINVIHGLARDLPMTQQEYRLFKRAAQQQQQIYQIAQSTETGKKQNRDIHAENTISFSNDDLQGLYLPHNDALVVTLRIENFAVKRVLIDQGSSLDIMYRGLFDKLKIKDEDFHTSAMPLTGFIEQVVIPMGKVELPVRVGQVVVDTKFLVVDVPSPYNAIMGRTWLHKTRAILSTFHQMLKVPSPQEIISIRGDQSASKTCFFATIKGETLPVVLWRRKSTKI